MGFWVGIYATAEDAEQRTNELDTFSWTHNFHVYREIAMPDGSMRHL
jgi:hypothetical protein